MRKTALSAAALAVAALSALSGQAQAAQTGYQGVSYSWNGYSATIHVSKALSHELVVDGASWSLDDAPNTWPQTLRSVSSLVVPAGETGDFTVSVPGDDGCGQRDLYAGNYQFSIPAHLTHSGYPEPTLAQILFPGNRNSYELNTSSCATPTPTASVTPSPTPSVTPTTTPSSTTSISPTPSRHATPSATSRPSPTRTSRPTRTPSPSATPSRTTSTPRPTATLKTPKPSKSSAPGLPTKTTSSTPTGSKSATPQGSSLPSTTRTAQVHGIPSGPADTGSGSSENTFTERLVGLGLVLLGLGALGALLRHRA